MKVASFFSGIGGIDIIYRDLKSHFQLQVVCFTQPVFLFQPKKDASILPGFCTYHGRKFQVKRHADKRKTARYNHDKPTQ